MKPSDFIMKKASQLQLSPAGKNSTYEGCYIQAVVDYLDEEWEKNQPCKHEELEDFRGQKACKKCRALVVR